MYYDSLKKLSFTELSVLLTEAKYALGDVHDGVATSLEDTHDLRVLIISVQAALFEHYDRMDLELPGDEEKEVSSGDDDVEEKEKGHKAT